MAAPQLEWGGWWVLQDRQRTLARRQHCSNCRCDLEIGEWARYQVIVTRPDREFVAGYRCFACTEGRR